MRAFLISMTVLASIVCAASSVPAAESGAAGSELRVILKDPQGKPIPADYLKKFFFCLDMAEEPIVMKPVVEDGVVAIPLTKQPLQMNTMLSVPGFGEVMVYADGSGKGYSKPGTIDFVAEAAATRLARVRAALKKFKAEGLYMPQAFLDKLSAAAKSEPYRSLATTLAAGEELAVARAKHRIAKYKGPREGFLFGCNTFGYPARGPIYQQRFRELFNYGSAHMYLSSIAPEENKRTFERTDADVAWLRSMGFTAKLSPPFYLARGVTPEWIRAKSYPEAKQVCHDLLLEVGKRYADTVYCTEIANESHMSNGLSLDADQLIEMTRIASDALREGAPKMKQIVNGAHLWGDYGAKLDSKGRVKLSHYAFLRACIKAGIRYDILGLQMYYPDYDLFEIDRVLDRYSKLGKPMHITELGCSSGAGLDPNAQRKKAAAGWHGDWDEQKQADWVTSVYTIYYSKPYIHAITWWDLADAVSFWPYGGMCRGDLSPKPSYTGLQELFQGWGFELGAKDQH